MIVVFGSLNVDMVMRVKKIPHPGETILCPNYQIVAGGKGANQAVAAANAGASVKLFGKLGDDTFGALLLRSLKESTVDLTGVTSCEGISTGCAAICVDPRGKNIVTVASGANLQAREAEIPDHLFSKDTTLLLQMETPVEENWKLIRRAKKFGTRILLNLVPAQNVPLDILKSLDVLIINQVEATLLSLHLGFDVISPAVAARRIAAKFGIICVVTLGKEGAIACAPKGTWEIKAMDIEVINTTAAGDAFIGVLAACLDKEMPLPLSLQHASIASGLSCLKQDTLLSLPSAIEIDKNLKRIPLPRQIA